MEQLSSLDSAFIHAEEPNLPMHLATLTIYDPSTSPDGKIRFKDIMTLFEQAVYNTPMFQRRLKEVPLDLDRPYWVEDPDFDIEYHVRHVALPKPGDWRQFYIQVARLNSRWMDRARPLWEAYVIEGLNHLEGVPKGSFAIMMKLHHAALSGEALRSLYTSIHTQTPDENSLTDDLPVLRRDVTPTRLPLLINAYQNSIKRTFSAGQVLGKTFKSYQRVQKAADKGDIRHHHEAVHCRFNGKPSAHRVVTSASFPFEDSRLARSALPGTTLNELIVTVIGGAVRQYLGEHRELPEESLVAQVPMRLNIPEENMSYSNNSSFVAVPIHNDIEDPLERFYAVHEEYRSAHSYLEARGEELTHELAEIVPPVISRNVLQLQDTLGKMPLLSHLYPAPANMVISNMYGQIDPVYFLGAELVTGMTLGPCMPDNGLFHTASTASGQLVIAVNACREMLPDPDFYQDCLYESWDATMAALLPEAERHVKNR